MVKQVEIGTGMNRFVMIGVCMAALATGCAAQSPGTSSSKSATLIGCLAGPDADDHYTLTSMQHRMGVQVVGDDELKNGAGAKVKLTGSWEALPGAEGKSGDATRQFKATAVSVMEEKCTAPIGTTPVSKKKAPK
jgi:hypothetical protein